MGKIFWLIVLIIVAVAIYNVFIRFGSEVKFGNLNSLFRIPSGLNRGVSPAVTVSPGGEKSAVKTPVPPKPTITLPAGFTINQLSPYYGQVEIYSASQGDSYAPSRLSIKTSSDYFADSPVNITGWRVKANKGVIFFIPGAVNDFNPSSLNLAADIILRKGDYVNLYSNFSPVGVGFRLNQCAGYLNSINKFNPFLPNSCPAMYNRSEITSFSGACQNLITSLWGCAVPSADQINSIPQSNDDQCRALLLNRFNYRGCYQYHRGDANFFSGEWWVWVNTAMNFDWSHDRLLLLDRNNLLVDEYVY